VAPAKTLTNDGRDGPAKEKKIAKGEDRTRGANGGKRDREMGKRCETEGCGSSKKGRPGGESGKANESS